MTKKFLIIFLTIFTIAGCKNTKSSTENTPTNGSSMSQNISNTKWVLITLAGAQVDQSKSKGKKIHFTLNSTTNTILGYSGCNTFRGTYTVDEGNRIMFSQLASTKMACPGTEINESDILKVFELADNYTISKGKLSLNIGRRAPLAVFEAVNF